MFPQGLDHVVTVTTQPADGENEPLGMSHDILGAEGNFDISGFEIGSESHDSCEKKKEASFRD